jgi:ATP-binding cassette, subfamily F, member 3
MLIGLQNVTFEFGARAIVEEATWHIHPNERIGLIGYNGTGKSTLLRLLVGEYSPSKGSVERSRGVSIGYLHQDLLSFDTNETILEVGMQAFDRVKQLEKEIAELGAELERTGDEDLVMVYSEKLQELDELGGYDVKHTTETVLQGLGFSNADLDRPYKEFSGGWRMRVLLAKMILQAPDVLLLDEPTNHLDLPSIEWLEKYLIHYKGSVVIVSHDKYFLNRMVNKIVEVYQQQLNIYTGNYAYYEKEKAIRIEMQQKAFENQQDYIRQQERFIERFKAKASKAAQAQSIVKRLDRLDRIDNAEMIRPNIRINFAIDKQPGKVLCALKDVKKMFGENLIVEGACGEIERGDKIALIGANGKGKSTLLRVIVGTEAHEGERIWGHNVQESFYAQHQLEALDMNNNLLEEMQTSGAGKTDQEYRNLLGGFLFGGDDVDKKVKVLSGGEKARVALAKVISSKANFLMLDEPTNHLDMHSVDLLIEALNKYEGTIILVSHDRYFVQGIATKIWWIEDCQLKEFKGNYEDWTEWLKLRAEREKLLNADAKKNAPKPTEAKPVVKEVAKPVAAEPAKGTAIDKDLQKEQQRIKKQFQQTELEIEKLNARKKEVENEMGNPAIYADRSKFVVLETEYKTIAEQLKALDVTYENLFGQLVD